MEVEWCGRAVTGTADGVDTHHGRIRGAAAATVQATMAAAGKHVHVDLMGVKAVRAFDGWVVIVKVAATAGGRSFRLLGSASCEDEAGLERAAAVSVLDATNRVLERWAAR